MSNTEKPAVAASTEPEPNRGIEFDDTRYSNHKYLVADDDRKYAENDLVFIGSGSKVYGPYRLGKIIAEGGGKQRWLAFKEGSGNSMRNKPKTKAELEQELASMQAEFLKLKQAQK